MLSTLTVAQHHKHAAPRPLQVGRNVRHIIGAHGCSGVVSGITAACLLQHAAACSLQQARERQWRKRNFRNRRCRSSVTRLRSTLGHSQRQRESSDESVPESIVLDFGPESEKRLEKVKNYTRTPVTLITGFLGAGKTSLLKHLLENKEGVRLGVVVNDVAAINIDAQLVQRYERDGQIELAELSNGCVCCTAADDLIASVQDLVVRAGSKPFHHIIIELSGVGEPQVVKSHWDIGVEVGMPATLMTEVVQSVAVVDASLFGKDWLDIRKAASRNDETADHVGFETVGQLLAEQVEKAEVVLLNKTDLASAEELATTREVVFALNATCQVIETTFGRADPSEVLPKIPDALRFPESGSGRHYRWAQNEGEVEIEVVMPPEARSKDINFHIGRTWLEVTVNGEEVPRLQGKLYGRLKSIDEWLWELEGQGEARVLRIYLEKSEANLWEDLWEKAPTEVAWKPPREFQDRRASSPAGNMLQSIRMGSDMVPQSLGAGQNAHVRFGIRSFVYERRRPFSSSRLHTLLRSWPLLASICDSFVLQDLSIDDDTDVAEIKAALNVGLDSMEAEAQAVILRTVKPILRSKGFCWVTAEPLKRHEWSHAGRSLGISPDSWWWSVLKEDQLNFQLSYPGATPEYERVKVEQWHDRWGDRRQELIFIGGPDMSESSITSILDACLLTDHEMLEFEELDRATSPPPEHFGIEGLLARLRGSPSSSS